MEIIYDLNYLGKEGFGGISRMWMELFRRLPSAPIEPTFIVGPAANKTQTFLEENAYFGGKVIHENPLWPKVSRFWFARTLRLLELNRRPGKAIFHSTDFINPLFRRKDLKLVTTIHDMVFWDQWRRFRKNVDYFSSVASIMHSLAVCDRIVTVSYAAKASIVKRFPAAEGKIEVIYHGLHESFRRLELSGRREKALLFLGARNYHKNYDLLLEAFAAFVRKNPEWRIWAVGENAHLKAQEDAKYARLGIADKIVDHGMIPEAKLMELFGRAGALVIPSLNEGFNFPLLEGMAAGIPVLSSDIPVSRELGRDFVRYFSPTSAAELLRELERLEGEPFPERLLAAAQVHARSFTWDESMKKLVAKAVLCAESDEIRRLLEQNP